MTVRAFRYSEVSPPYVEKTDTRKSDITDDVASATPPLTSRARRQERRGKRAEVTNATPDTRNANMAPTSAVASGAPT